jgi:hypothetical protein
MLDFSETRKRKLTFCAIDLHIAQKTTTPHTRVQDCKGKILSSFRLTVLAVIGDSTICFAVEYATLIFTTRSTTLSILNFQ